MIPNLEGACLQADPELFFYPFEMKQGKARERAIETARAVCNSCPIVATCRARTMAEEGDSGLRWGMWGGLTPQERIDLAADNREPVAPTGSKCGTWAGYVVHKKVPEGACDPCREAARVYSSQRRARQLEVSA